MLAYIVRRLFLTLPVMALVAVFVFLLLHLSPGDPAAIMAGENATSENIAAIRTKLGLDEPLWKQFALWAFALLTGDLGQSLFWGDPVTTLIGQRAEPTVSLALTTISFAVIVAISLGVVAAANPGTWVDRGVMGFAVMGFSLPVFVVGYMLIFLFAIELKWLPVQGYRPLAQGFDQTLRSIALPSIALGLVYMALIARITRASMLEVLGSDYIRTARAKGVPEFRVVFKHALRNAILPTITITGLHFGTLLSGAVLVETVFNWPGLSGMLVAGVNARDYPVVTGVLVVVSAFYIGLNLLVDIIYGITDPRVRK